MTQNNKQSDEVDDILTSCVDTYTHAKARIEAKQSLQEWADKQVVAYRNKISGSADRPLSAEPEVVKQPVPCPKCGAEKYADWTLYPHQLYNQYMPGGVGHYCFPCFCKIVTDFDKQVVAARIDELQKGCMWASEYDKYAVRRIAELKSGSTPKEE